MTDDVAGTPRAVRELLTARFSPDLARRLVVEPLLPPILTRLLGPGQVMRASQFAQLPAPDDGTHLNGPGYEAWVHVLRPHMDRMNTPIAPAGAVPALQIPGGGAHV